MAWNKEGFKDHVRLYEHIGQTLEAARWATTQNRNEVSRVMGVTNTTVRYIETAKSNISMAHISALCMYYGIPISSVFPQPEEIADE